MISYTDCTPNELDYTIGKGGTATVSVDGNKFNLTFKDVPGENPEYMSVRIISDPKQVLDSMVIDAYAKDNIDDPATEETVKEKLANCINAAVKNRFGLI